jgi:YfiH family protein
MKVFPSIISSALLSYPDVVHGFSTRRAGDMRNLLHRDIFLRQFSVGTGDLVWPQQVHGDAIYEAKASDRGKEIQGIDAIVARKTGSQKLVLGVHTADCVPILAVDPAKHIIGAAHAGWKGTLKRISRKFIQHMANLGSLPRDIRIFIGPRICSRCYHVEEARALLFLRTFGRKIIQKRKGRVYLDIGYANYLDILSAGIPKKQIDYNPAHCTCCNPDVFYSFRASFGALDGENMGFVGFGGTSRV